MEKNMVTIAHGSGGAATSRLIEQTFKKHFDNDILSQGDDCARLDIGDARNLVFTTDSFVVTPIFFNGGNIGKLAVCGTVNDLATSGAKPLYLSCGFIIEEGFDLEDLEEIVKTMSATARECGVKIVTGDTKVVQKGAADKVFINTSGIGVIPDGLNISGKNAKAGDKIIISGTIGDHGSSIFLERENMGFQAKIQSDCAPLSGMVQDILSVVPDVHVLRDPTRGGVATTLNEIAVQSNVSILIREDSLPVKREVQGVCELLGMDPLYMANEGKMLCFVSEDKSERVLEVLRKNKYGKDARIIGEVTEERQPKVLLKALSGGNRIISVLAGDQLPRIC
ncbi:hydrogenase expression/formation protein HypE [Ruminiclostridium cellulolyticum]|uniref:Hydrogenase expression/formation protein HypE n=1 Tax=Ruminiclostridium cellulolyticum (strain ATCC 35319 / DSM 5812 / JCM 6584 / H10) TaxID=394503 RepID=B8I6F5_RUMCH|nr:hydrogenase expression/formation protein HypE [Ruminiclostridium cellulolyticum]ACL74847.1 hydrogenase expression/formation protein HypE [Ruminiclostridium cellulolyticum H10]